MFQSLPLDNTKKQNTNKNTKRIFYYKVWDHVWKKIERKKSKRDVSSNYYYTLITQLHTQKISIPKKKKSPISWKLIHTIYSLLCCWIETILQRMPSNLVKMQKFQTFQKKKTENKRDEKYILTNDAGPLREIFFLLVPY